MWLKGNFNLLAARELQARLSCLTWPVNLRFAFCLFLQWGYTCTCSKNQKGKKKTETTFSALERAAIKILLAPGSFCPAGFSRPSLAIYFFIWPVTQ